MLRKEVSTVREVLKKVLYTAPLLAVAAFAQDFNASEIAGQVRNYILGIAAAGVGVLALAIGLTAAWKYARRFLKG